MSSKSNFSLPQLLRERHSTRNFDAAKPITLAELAQFLDATSRIHATFESKIEELGEESPRLLRHQAVSGGGRSYELELYLAVDQCEGLARGFYHYAAADHALEAIDAPPPAFDAFLSAPNSRRARARPRRS